MKKTCNLIEEKQIIELIKNNAMIPARFLYLFIRHDGNEICVSEVVIYNPGREYAFSICPLAKYKIFDNGNTYSEDYFNGTFDVVNKKGDIIGGLHQVVGKAYNSTLCYHDYITNIGIRWLKGEAFLEINETAKETCEQLKEGKAVPIQSLVKLQTFLDIARGQDKDRMRLINKRKGISQQETDENMLHMFY